MRGYPTRRRRRWPVVLAVLLLAVGAFVLLAPYYSTQLWWSMREVGHWLAPLVVVVLLALAGFAARAQRVRGGGWLLLAALLGAVGYVPWLVVHDYVQAVTYAASVRITDDPVPALDVRVPFSVSAAQVRSNLGDVPGDTQDTMYVPEDETFATLVEQRGFATGYRTLLEQSITTTGRNTPSRCDFDTDRAGARLGGWFGGNLGRAINTQRRGVNWHQDDAYGWCAPDGTPYAVVPLVRQTGLFVITEEPAGLALYDGRTGELEFRGTGDGVPGPTYPLSLAAAQRAATPAMDGFRSWLFGVTGWELPDEADSINSGNASEFVLGTGDGGERYVTPVSGRGAATAISAITVVDARLAGPGLAPLTVHRLGDEQHPVWQSATAITDRIRANFGDVFAQQRESGIYELAPTGPDTWVATIGTPQNMIYRVTGFGDLRQDPCLQALDGTELRCGPTGDIGVATGPARQPGGPAPAPADSDLATLTPQQLADLVRRASDELARRAEGGG